MAGYFIILSIIGIGIGLFLTIRGFQGHGLGAAAVAVLGLFFTVKEILDIINSRG